MVKMLTQRLSFRQAVDTVLVALLLSLILTGLQVLQTSLDERERVGRQVGEILDSLEQPAASAAYALDPRLAADVLRGILSYDAVRAATLISDLDSPIGVLDRPPPPPSRWDGLHALIAGWVFGPAGELDRRLFVAATPRAGAGRLANLEPMRYVGVLRVTIDTQRIAAGFVHRIALFVLGDLVRNLLLGLVIAAMFHLMVTKPAMQIARALALVDPLEPGRDSVAVPRGHERDELGFLVGRVNELLATVAHKERDRARHEAALMESEERLRLAVTATRSGVWDLNLETGEYWWSPEFVEALGYVPGELVADRRSWEALVHPEDMPEVLRRTEHHRASRGTTFKRVYRMRRGDGRWIWIKDRVLVMRDGDGRAQRFTGIMRDITEHKEAEDQLRHYATHDLLTNLPNRALIQDRLARSIAAAAEEGSKVAILFLDLDRFKLINDTLGHPAGDQLLRQTARRLDLLVGRTNTLGRLGGDEFVIVLEAVRADHEIARVANALRHCLQEPFVIEGRSLSVTASIGISVFPDDAPDVSSLLKHADTAMYGAKAEAGNRYRFYTSQMHEDAVTRLGLEQSLRDAVERQEFELWYQPKVDAKTLGLVGFEALIRWRHPVRGYIPPLEFIPVAEENGLILPIGDWVLEEACRQLHAWRREGIGLVPVAVNVSAKQLVDRGLIARTASLLEQYGLQASQLQIEITESVLMHNFDKSEPILRELRDLGVRISMDDFGTGYSSLAYLKRLPISTLKIDRAFVRNLPHDLDDAAITGAIIGLGHKLGMRVIAEGVETHDHRQFLDHLGCDELQGYLVSPPRPADEIAATYLRRAVA